MRYLHRDGSILYSRRELPRLVPKRRCDPGFVVRRERAHAVTEPLHDERGILRKSIGRAAVGPAIVFTLQRGWKIPVIESREGFDAALEQPIDQTLVEIHA